MTGFRASLLAALMMAPSLVPLEAQGNRRYRDERRSIDTTFAFSKTGKISLEISIGEIRVTGWARNEVRIVATSTGGLIDTKLTSEEISLDVERRGRAHFELNVPIGVSVSAATASGSVIVSGTKGEVSVEAQGGAVVEVSDVVGRGEFQVMSGRLTLQRLDGQISVATLSGPVSIAEIKGGLEMESTGGNVTIERADLSSLEFTAIADTFTFSGTLSATGRHQIETMGGVVTLRFPADFGATLDIETWNGQFHPVDFPVTLQPSTTGGRGRATQRQQFTINGGGARISIETNIGDVYLRKIVAPARREQ